MKIKTCKKCGREELIFNALQVCARCYVIKTKLNTIPLPLNSRENPIDVWCMRCNQLASTMTTTTAFCHDESSTKHSFVITPEINKWYRVHDNNHVYRYTGLNWSSHEA